MTLLKSSTNTLDSWALVCGGWRDIGLGGRGVGCRRGGRPAVPSYVQVEFLHEQIQVSNVGCLEELRLVHHGEGDPQGGPDVPGHHLVGQLVTPALPLQTQGRQEVAGRLPEGSGQTRAPG